MYAALLEAVMDEGSSKFSLMFFVIAVAALFLLTFAVPLFANMFVGLGIEIPAWVLRVSPRNPMRALLAANAGALGVLTLLAMLLRSALKSK